MRLGITMGDPGGIGPEVILKALVSSSPPETVIYGSPSAMSQHRDALVDAGVLDSRAVEEALAGVEIVDVAPTIRWQTRPVGPTGKEGAIVQKRALQQAMEHAEHDQIDAIVTAPWNKSLFAEIGEPVVGHTEKLSEFFGVDDVVMMLAGRRLRVVLVTTHIPVGRVAAAVNADTIETTVEVTARALKNRFGVDDPRLAVCGLNPHAGEQGHMGREELDVIEPAVERMASRLSSSGVQLEGPFPADTLFAKFRDNQPYDAVVCMYHDQGLIPLKLLHFGASANITLGLPVIRTSVDHGTAYDIAAKGVADAGSMKFAIDTAAKMVRRRSGSFDED